MLNKYRYIRYTDDGCSLYECLSCKQTMEIRYSNLNFCPNCGIKFNGELKWEKRYGDRRRLVENKSYTPSVYYHLQSCKEYHSDNEITSWSHCNTSVGLEYNPLLQKYSYFVKSVYLLKKGYEVLKRDDLRTCKEFGISDVTIHYRIVKQQDGHKILKTYPLESLHIK